METGEGRRQRYQSYEGRKMNEQQKYKIHDFV
jgi:hypothetical protein